MKNASVFKRVVSFVVDIGLIYLTAFFFIFIFRLKFSTLTLMTIAAFYSAFYFLFYWIKFNGQTLGNFIMGIQVVSIDGDIVGFKSALLRFLILLPFIFPYGIIVFLAVLNVIETIIIFRNTLDEDMKQTAWDKGSKTFVIEKKAIK